MGSGYYVVYPMINSGAGTYGQQWYKVDGGTSSWWELVTSITYVYPDMAVDPTNPNRIFYVEGNQEIINCHGQRRLNESDAAWYDSGHHWYCLHEYWCCLCGSAGIVRGRPRPDILVERSW